ncbi:MAG: ABC transporter permease [Actinobacteria bacterium]|nr:ABC transporter permease [Actinomycetota bacterium]
MVFFVLLIAIWEAIYRFHFWPGFLFPSPFSVTLALIDGFNDKTFLIAIIASLRRILIGYLIALMLGVMIGLLLGKYKIFDETIGSFIVGLQAIPSIAWLPLALLWFGLNDKAIIFIVFLSAGLIMIISTDAGVKGVPPILLRAAKTMGANDMQIFKDVVLPASIPSIVSGMRLAWAFAWRGLVAGELLASNTGLGQVLMMGRNMGDMRQVISVMIIIAMIGLLTDGLFFKKMERNIRRKWGLESR